MAFPRSRWGKAPASDVSARDASIGDASFDDKRSVCDTRSVAGRFTKTLGREVCGGAPKQTFRQVPALTVEVEAQPSARGIGGRRGSGEPRRPSVPHLSGTGPKDAGTTEGHQDAEILGWSLSMS